MLDRLSRSSVFESALEFAQRLLGSRYRAAAIGPYLHLIQQFSSGLRRFFISLWGRRLHLSRSKHCRQLGRFPLRGHGAGARYFISRRESAQARALRHVFFAERDLASRRRTLARQAPVRAVDSVAVIGAGTMGSGIALCLANAGIATVLIDTQPAALDRGRAAVERYYVSALRKAASPQKRRLSMLGIFGTKEVLRRSQVQI